MPLQNFSLFGAPTDSREGTETSETEETRSAATTVKARHAEHLVHGNAIGDWGKCRAPNFPDLVPDEIPCCLHVAAAPRVSCVPFKNKDEMPRQGDFLPPAQTPSPLAVSPAGREVQSNDARSLNGRQQHNATIDSMASFEDSPSTDGRSHRGLEMATCTTATESSTCFGGSSANGEEERCCSARITGSGRNDGENSGRRTSLKLASGRGCQENQRAACSLPRDGLRSASVYDLNDGKPRAMSTLKTNTPGAVRDEASAFGSTSAAADTKHARSEEGAYAQDETKGAPPAKAQSLFVPCVAVFSSNYNFTVTSIALFLMNQDPRYKTASEQVVGNSTIKMLSYAGAIFGMCTMGYLGDLIGRRRAMVFTLSLVFIGALCSSVCSWGSAVTVLSIMGICRFVLGVGSGGVYPLSAVSAAEGAASEQADERSMRVSWAYSMNVPGIMFPYVLALLLWWSTHNVDISFRVLLAFGAVPVIFILLPAWRNKAARDGSTKDFLKHLASVFVTRRYWRQLLGTGICWLLYDVTAYGILLVQPEITQVIWKGRSSVIDIIWQNIILNAIGIPGCYMGILVLQRMGVKWLQFWGFMGLAGSAFLLAGASIPLKDVAWAQMVLLCIVNYFINWGASITTFILPSLVFPPEVRSTYSGISAALGKIGAVAGIYTMKAILSSGGLVPMMVCAGLPSLLAALLTWWYVDPVPNTLKSSFLQCFGSLANACPFIECRRRARRHFAS